MLNKYKTLNTLCTISLSLFCTTVSASQETKSAYYKNVFLGISVDSNYFLSSIDEYIDSTTYIFSYNTHKVIGYSIMAGKRWNHLGLQIGYSIIPTTKSDSLDTEVTLKYNNKFADALFFYPVNELCDFKSLLGIGLMHSEINGSVSYHYPYYYKRNTKYFNLSRDQLSPRLGLGAEYKIGSHVNMDIMAKYQKVNLLYRNNITISIGIYYHL